MVVEVESQQPLATQTQNTAQGGRSGSKPSRWVIIVLQPQSPHLTNIRWEKSPLQLLLYLDLFPNKSQKFAKKIPEHSSVPYML